jgi:tetratricopeptide (TPR) repeat protein
VSSLRAKVFYFFNPPGKVVFSPGQQEEMDAIVSMTLTAMPSTLTPTLKPSLAPTVLMTSTPTETRVPTITPTAIPDSVILQGVRHEYQKMNNCGPATLAMALSYWGWAGDQETTRPWLRPHPDDRNIMPEEMAAAVKIHTDLDALVRSGGDTHILKQFIAAGFPVIIERDMGDVRPNEDWTGHYGVITGYDDSRERFILQDSFVMADYPLAYVDHYRYWRAFNHIYVVIFPPEREPEVLSILGAHADVHFNLQHAEEIAQEAINELDGRDLFFAWFNLGTSRVNLGDYFAAAQAYDHAYNVVYPTIPSAARPWRMTWYQTGPYAAYYYTGRYQDVVNLATFTIVNSGVQEIEETWLWRGRARLALGDVDGAIDDFHTALKFHPGWEAALAELNNLGVIP